MSHPRTRMAAVAASVALALTFAAAPAMAQGEPTDTITELLETITAKDFDALPGYFCEESADQAAQFDLSSLTEGLPEGVDAQALLDAFVLDIELDALETLSQTETDAVVRVAGTLSMEVDTEALLPFVQSMIEASGLEVDDTTVQMFMGIIASEFAPMSESVDGEVALVVGEDRPWLICGDLDFGGVTAEGSPSPADPAPPAAEASPSA